MKSNFFKYLFIVFAIGIMIFAIVKIKSEEGKNTKEETKSEIQGQEKITELKLGIASFDSINPILSQNKNVQDVTKLIFEPLINLTTDYKAEACLAKEWAKQNETTYLIKLKENVKWSDGEKFTAEDVKFTIDRLKENHSIYSAHVKDVVSVDIVDEQTIRIHLGKEIPFFEYQLTFPILSNKYYQDKAFDPNIVPVGTGMYKVTEIQSSGIVLSKNENWWNQEKNLTLDKITINLYSSMGELYNSFKMGNIDLISTQNSSLQDYIGTIGYASKEMKGREHDFIAFNMKNALLAKTEIRKAIVYSIDKENIASSIYQNRYEISSFPFDFGTWIYQEQNTSSGYNPEQAKQILVDNGWNYKYKYWQKQENYKTQKISFNFVVKASDQKRVEVAENIKAQLENQGIRINVIKASEAQYQSYLANKNYDMILCNSSLSPSPDMTTYFGENNLANYSNEEVTNIMNEIKNTTDENTLKQKFKRLAEIYKSDMPYLSLYTNKFIVAYNTGLIGEMTPNWFQVFYHIENWYK